VEHNALTDNLWQVNLNSYQTMLGRST
jgi:hypothetical protein